MSYYVGTKAACEKADAIITSNCGWPKGKTTNWANPVKLADGKFCIPVPQGSHGFTQEEMIEGVDMTIKETVEFIQVDDA